MITGPKAKIMLGKKKDVQARFGACSEKWPRENRCAKIHVSDIQCPTKNLDAQHPEA
jgi:hypothetical protein